jgi:hypothetical protein
VAETEPTERSASRGMIEEVVRDDLHPRSRSAGITHTTAFTHPPTAPSDWLKLRPARRKEGQPRPQRRKAASEET